MTHLRDFDAAMAEGNRIFFSAGLHYKVRKLTLWAEGYWGEIDGNSEEGANMPEFTGSVRYEFQGPDL